MVAPGGGAVRLAGGRLSVSSAASPTGPGVLVVSTSVVTDGSSSCVSNLASRSGAPVWTGLLHPVVVSSHAATTILLVNTEHPSGIASFGLTGSAVSLPALYHVAAATPYSTGDSAW